MASKVAQSVQARLGERAVTLPVLARAPSRAWSSVELARLEDDPGYPAGPERHRIEAFSVAAHRQAWGCSKNG